MGSKTSLLSSSDDIKLLRLIQSGDHQAFLVLFERYQDIVNLKAKLHYLNGADKEDVIQEASIGLHKAIKNYNPNNDIDFKSFATFCITRQIFTAIRKANRDKHYYLNSSLNLDYCCDWQCDINLDPLTLMIRKEENLVDYINKYLSSFEKKVLCLRHKELNYQEIADYLKCNIKAVDNAWQRIVGKARKIKGNINNVFNT